MMLIVDMPHRQSNESRSNSLTTPITQGFKRILQGDKEYSDRRHNEREEKAMQIKEDPSRVVANQTTGESADLCKKPNQPWKLIAPYQENYRENPLGDCTNTVSRTSQQTSAFSATLVKFTFLSQEISRSDFAQEETLAKMSITQRLVPEALPRASGPLTFKNCLLCLGVGDKEVAESYTVRRKASGGKRSKEASSSSAVARLPLHLISIPRRDLVFPLHEAVIQVAFHSGLVFGFRLRIQIVMAGRKRSSSRNAPSGVDTVEYTTLKKHKSNFRIKDVNVQSFHISIFSRVKTDNQSINFIRVPLSRANIRFRCQQGIDQKFGYVYIQKKWVHAYVYIQKKWYTMHTRVESVAEGYANEA
ncbi:hypothetical protein YC2023_052418 [Brassica napus]